MESIHIMKTINQTCSYIGTIMVEWIRDILLDKRLKIIESAVDKIINK